MRNVNEVIKQMIRARGLRVKDVAAEIGVSQATLYKIMSGKRKVYADEVARIAKALGCEANDLFHDGGMIKARKKPGTGPGRR